LETNEVFVEGSDYSDNTSYQISNCLPGDCYRFTIFDSYGDGICCAYGQGSYSVSVNGQEIGSGSDFGSNESLEFCLSGASECTGGTFSLDLLTDQYGDETSWSLTDLETNEVFVEGSDYSDNTSYQISNCLPGDCYRFTIFDSYGDGICCAYGQGSYSVSVNGQEIGSGSDFGSSESLEFCLSDDSGCEDSPLSIYFNESTLSCDSLESYCSSESYGNIVSSHCPVTCGACSEYACEDSMAPWSVGGDVYTCFQLANYAQVGETCNDYSNVAITCAGTCEVCG